jgi:hypothetical protein
MTEKKSEHTLDLMRAAFPEAIEPRVNVPTTAGILLKHMTTAHLSEALQPSPPAAPAPSTDNDSAKPTPAASEKK